MVTCRYIGVLEDLESSLRVLATVLPAFFSPPAGANDDAGDSVFAGVKAHVRPKHDLRGSPEAIPSNLSEAHWRELEARAQGAAMWRARL